MMMTMALLLPNGFAYHVMRFVIAGSSKIRTITLGSTWDPLTYSLDQVAGDLEDAYTAEINPSMSDAYTLQNIVSLGNDGGAVILENDRPVGLVGADAGDPESPQVAVLVQKRTGASGRQYRGRNYWMGLAEAANVDPNGQLTLAALAIYQAAFDDFLTAFNGAFTGSNLVLLHNDIPGAPAPTNIASFNVVRQVATQRRRVG